MVEMIFSQVTSMMLNRYQRISSAIVESVRRDWPVHLIFLALLALRLYAFSSHEIWRDEVQYYLRVRDATSFWDLIQGIRYERSLPLWPAMLYGLKMVGLNSIYAMQIMHLCVSALVLGIIIYGLRSIPLVFRGLVGTSYLLVYEYSVLARSYVLTILFLAIFLFLELRGSRHVIWKMIVLFLMSLTNINGLVLAVALSVYLFFILPKGKLSPKILLISIVGAGILFSAYTAWVPGPMNESPQLVDYRASAFDMFGVPRAIETISHITLDGFFYLPQVTNEHWWDLLSVWGHWLMADYRTLYIIASLSVTAGIWVLVKLFRASFGLGLAAIIFWAGNFTVLAIMHPGDIRHLGVIVMGTLAFIPLAKNINVKFSLGKICTWLICGALAIQAISGIWAVYAESKQVFSQGQNVAEWIKSNYPDKKLIVYPDYSGITIAAYTGGYFYSIESDKEVSYVQMDAERSNDASIKMINRIQLDPEGRLLITTTPNDYRIIDGRISIEPLKMFGPAVEFGESNYYAFQVRPISNEVWHTKVLPFVPTYVEGTPEYIYDISDDTLSINTSGTQLVVFVYPENGFENSIGTTAEISLKLFAAPKTDHDASFFSLQDGNREGKISFFSDRIEIRDKNVYKATYMMDTGDEFHCYRMSIIKDTLSVYVDDEKITSVLLTEPAESKLVMFGDGSKMKGENFNVELMYIAYSTNGAMSPEGKLIQPDRLPTAPMVRVTPLKPTVGDNLICEIIKESIDPDGDNITYSYAWYKNGIIQPNLITNYVNSLNISWGEMWECIVTPNDGIANGPPGIAQAVFGSGAWSKISGMLVSPETEQESPWNINGKFDFIEAAEGILTLITDGNGVGLLTNSGEGFDNTIGTTIEIKMKLISSPHSDHDASFLSVQDGDREGKISFFSDRVEIRDQNTLKAVYDMNTTDDFHIYRMTILNDSLKVYIDNQEVADISLDNFVYSKAVMFGDGSIKTGENFIVLVDYIVYSNQEAIKPQEILK